MQPEPSDHDKNKADEEFLQYSSRFSPLSPLKALTAIGLPLALYQILTGFIYSSNQASLFNISLTISGFFTLTLLGLALNWIRSAVNDGEKEMVLFDKKRESLSTLSFFIFSILKLGTAPLMISNLILQKNYIGDYLTASSGANAFDELGAPLIAQHESAGTLNTLAVLFIVTEVVFFFYAMFATATTFSFVKRPRKMHANFTYIANAVLLGAALSLAFTASRVYNLENYSRLENLFPSWNLKALLGLGAAASGLTFAVWLVNFRKWRIGFFAMALVLGNLGLLSLVFTGFAYSHSNGVYQHYSNTENMKQLQGRMSYVSQEELTNYGCPAKYLPQENCGNSMLLTAWESDAQTGGSESCLNIKCAGLLGQIYSDKFTQVANWGLLTAVTSILMAGSLLYSSVNRGAFKHERRSRKNFSWLALLGTVGIVCVLTYGLNPAQNIQEYKQENNLETTEAWTLGSLFSGIRAPTITTPSVTMPTVRMPSVTMPSISMPTVRMPTLSVPTLTVPSLSTIGQGLSNALGLNNNVAYQVAQMTQSKDSRYIILNPNVATKQVEVSKTGAISETYQNFVDSLDSQKSQLGLVRTTVNGQEQVVGILWAPKTAPTAEQDLLVKTFVPDYSSVSYSDTLKVPIVVAADKNALTIANIESKLATLQTSKAWGFSDIQDAADDYSSTLRAPGAPGPGVKNMKTWGWQDINAAVDQYQAGADAAQELGEENIDSLRAGPGMKTMSSCS